MDLTLKIGSQGMELNEFLIERNGLLDEDILDLRRLHTNRLMIWNFIEDNLADLDRDTLGVLDDELTKIEFDLQETWGFPQSQKHHKFWERPGCKCPKMDNEERYPTGMYIYMGDCPSHGSTKFSD